MRQLALAAFVLACLCLAPPARALEYCDNVKEPGKRMACLQERISSLEEKLLALSNQIVDLRNALKQKLEASNVYKLQHMGQMACLGVSEDDKDKDKDKDKPKDVDLQGCDHPDAWKLLPGSQRPGREEKKKKE